MTLVIAICFSSPAVGLDDLSTRPILRVGEHLGYRFGYLARRSGSAVFGWTMGESGERWTVSAS